MNLSKNNFGNNFRIPTELPICQKKIVELLRSGKHIWTDNFGKTTYHIKSGRKVINLFGPNIDALIFRGFLNPEDLSLTEYGQKVTIYG